MGGWGRHIVQQSFRQPDGFFHHLVDTLHEAPHEDLEEQFPVARDSLSRFLDHVAVATYASVEIHRVVAFGPSEVRPGAEFMILIPGPPGFRTTRQISAEDFPEGPSNSVDLLRANSLLRKALIQDAAEDRLVTLYATLEAIAAMRAEPREEACGNCGHSKVVGKATWRFMEQALVERGLSRSEVQEFRSLRNKIVHGGADRTHSFFKHVERVVGSVEPNVLGIVAEAIQLPLKASQQIRTVDPRVLLRLEATDFDFHFLGATISAEVTAPSVGTGSDTPSDEVFWGIPGLMPLKWQLDPLIWPSVLPRELPDDKG